MTIRNSYFEKNGFCGNACSHGIYAGHLDVLHVENSRFFDTQHAHHMKSRAARTEIVGCDIQDGPNGTASYEVEVPNGGSVIVRNSTIVKGPNADNHTAAIMIGSEGVTQMTPQIVIENNAFETMALTRPSSSTTSPPLSRSFRATRSPALGRSVH